MKNYFHAGFVAFVALKATILLRKTTYNFKGKEAFANESYRYEYESKFQQP